MKLVELSRVDTLEQDRDGVTVHTKGPGATWWRGSYLVGCDGARSTVRKLLDIRFPGRTAVERHAVAALRADLPWPGEAVLHRQPPWRTGGAEVGARPLPDGVWRLDWLLPPRGELVTPDALITRIRDSLAGWCGETPPYELLDTGVHTLHHRLARRWRVQRAFLAGDAAHLLGALGTQGLDEGIRDAENLAWKLAHAWHHGGTDLLLDSYQAERRAAVAARLRAADQSLPILRGGGGLRTLVPGAARSHDTLLADGHLGCGALGAPPSYTHSPLAPPHAEAHTTVGTPPGAPVADVRVTAPDGTSVRLRERLGQGHPLVILVAPGTGVWDRRHWLTAGIMPRLVEAVEALPSTAELLVTESYPGASAHTVLLVRPDGHLVAAFAGVRPAELFAAARAALGGLTGAGSDAGSAESGDGESGDRKSDGDERGRRARRGPASGFTPTGPPGSIDRHGRTWCTPDHDRHRCAPVAEGPYGPPPLRGLRVSPVLLNRPPLPVRAAFPHGRDLARTLRTVPVSSPLLPYPRLLPYPPPPPPPPDRWPPLPLFPRGSARPVPFPPVRRSRSCSTSCAAPPRTPRSSPLSRSIRRAAPGSGSTGQVAARPG